MTKKFLRRTWSRYSKLGKRRKKKQTWKSPKGRHSKTREKRKGYPKPVSIGYKKDKKLRNKINEKIPVIIHNIKELEKIKDGEIAIIGKVGKEKKIEILKKAKEKKIPIYNINVKKFLEKIKNKEKKWTLKRKKNLLQEL